MYIVLSIINVRVYRDEHWDWIAAFQDLNCCVLAQIKLARSNSRPVMKQFRTNFKKVHPSYCALGFNLNLSSTNVDELCPRGIRVHQNHI